MSSHTITWSECIDQPWLRWEPCLIGEIPAGLGTPALYILLSHDDDPMLRVDAYPSPHETFAFNDAILWRNYFVIGWGHHVYLIHLESRAIIEHEFGSYFGHLYAFNDYLLVASADRLQRIAPDGSLVWQSDVLGIDGVIVNDVDDGIVDGSGEWDPPGGWRPFQIHLATGQRVKAT